MYTLVGSVQFGVEFKGQSPASHLEKEEESYVINGNTDLPFMTHCTNMLRSVFLSSFIAFSVSVKGVQIIANGSSLVSIADNNASNLALSETLTSPFPYEFPAFADAQNLFPMPLCNGVRLEEATIDELQDAMANGQLTSTQITLCYLQRIYQTDEYIK